MPSTRTAAVLGATAALLLAAGPQLARAETDDVIWHDRYHALLAMSVYGDYDSLCPSQTFTQSGLEKNFPNSTLPPWTVLERFGPTEHGAEGFTVLVPEMGKVVLVFKGDYNLEKSLNTTSASLDALGDDFATACNGFDNGANGDCAVNAFALAGYLEASAATDNFAYSKAVWEAYGMYFSITGHGLGGMHSLIASIDLGQQNISKFTHSYGAPRTFNAGGRAYFDYLYGGDMTERATANNDSFPYLISADAGYEFTNTAIYYYGYNATYQMNMDTCYEQPDDTVCQSADPTSELDHYFYFANVGQCGGADTQDTAVASSFIASATASSYTGSATTVSLHSGSISGLDFTWTGAATSTSTAHASASTTASSSSATGSAASSSSSAGSSAAVATAATSSSKAASGAAAAAAAAATSTGTGSADVAEAAASATGTSGALSSVALSTLTLAFAGVASLAALLA